MRNNTLAILIGLVCLLAPWVSYGSDFQQQQNPLYPSASSIFLQDDFVTGGTASTTIGALGWTASGTITRIASELNRTGLYTVSTGAVSATFAGVYWFQNTALVASQNHSIQWYIRVNTNDANTLIRTGLMNSIVASPPTNGIYFEKLDADTNWFCVTRNGGVETRTDSGVAVSTNFVNHAYTRNSTGVFFRIDNALVCTHTTNVTNVAATPGIQILNSAALAKTMDLDYFQINITGITR